MLLSVLGEAFHQACGHLPESFLGDGDLHAAHHLFQIYRAKIGQVYVQISQIDQARQIHGISGVCEDVREVKRTGEIREGTFIESEGFSQFSLVNGDQGFHIEIIFGTVFPKGFPGKYIDVRIFQLLLYDLAFLCLLCHVAGQGRGVADAGGENKAVAVF